MTNKIKVYKKEFDYSYTSGAYATIEMIRANPKIVEAVYIHSAYRDIDGLAQLCAAHGIGCIFSDKAFTIVNQKENSYVLGVFRKYKNMLAHDEPHVVLVNPSDSGNLGTIIRTIAGLNIKNLAIIEPAADIWNPKTVRASMGALFHIKHACFGSFEAYKALYPEHSLFPFMLNGQDTPDSCMPCKLFSLVFGNEASGLDQGFARMGNSVKITLSQCVDSYNLGVAVGIGAYVFAVKNQLV